VPVALELGVDSVEDVLTHLFHLDGNKRGDEFDILCPNPNHMDTSPSCGVNLVTGLWNCFSCGVSGDLLALGSLTLDTPRDAVEALLKPSTPEALLSMVQRRLASIAVRPTRHRKHSALVLPGPYEDGPLDELLERGFTSASLERWGVRFVPEQTLQGNKGEFTIRNSYAIPIRDSNGVLLNWCYRATRASGAWQPRYLYYTEGVNETWFGLQHHATARHITIVEGGLDTIWLDQCGFPALGLLGTKMGERKIRWLNRFDSVTLLCDRDTAGATATHKIGEMLGHSMPLYVALYDRKINPGKKCDPQDLAPIDVEIAMARRISWSAYLIRKAG
jgi:5S rRNA maturation endonuclease (ribonuclease M5)